MAPSDAALMRAIGLTEFGGPEVLKIVDLPEPSLVVEGLQLWVVLRQHG